MAFDTLQSQEAQARLSMCRPVSGMQCDNSISDGFERYAHTVGEVFWKKRSPWQLASTMGFVLNRNNGSFLKSITPEEQATLHEIITWAMQPGNNKILEYFGPDLAAFDSACQKLASKFRTLLPEGSVKLRIRAAPPRHARRAHREETMEDTLGSESTGLVEIDFQGHPVLYDQLEVYSSVVAEHTQCRLDVDYKQERGGWRRAGTLDTANFGDLNDQWRSDLRSGALQLKQRFVKAGEAHYDAMLFPHVHPHGTGSLRGEATIGCPTSYTRNRAMALQSFFRRSSLWPFWQLDTHIKTKLFYTNVRRKQMGVAYGVAGAGADTFAQTYGTIVPSDVPESSAWWHKQTKELAAITDDREGGLMNEMVTISRGLSCAHRLC